MSSTFLQDILKGLSQKQKRISSKYLYDKKGSELFEDICHLEEYYITRAETEILKNNYEDIVSNFKGKVCIIEPGAGNGKKAGYLLKSLSPKSSYIPIEISPVILQELEKNLKKDHPHIVIHSILGDFENEEILKQLSLVYNDSHKVLFFPGSTIGNLEVRDAIAYLNKMMKVIASSKKKSGIFLGVDIVKKDISFIEKAYNDKKNITAQFNKNVLTRCNQELQANFDLKKFRHLAFFNREKSRIEMHLQSLKDQMVIIQDKKIFFRENETIHTENSYKYDLTNFAKILKKSKLKLEKVWYDSKKLFSFCYITRDI